MVGLQKEQLDLTNPNQRRLLDRRAQMAFIEIAKKTGRGLAVSVAIVASVIQDNLGLASGLN